MRKVKLVQPSTLLCGLVAILILTLYGAIAFVILIGYDTLGNTLAVILLGGVTVQGFNDALNLHIPIFSLSDRLLDFLTERFEASPNPHPTIKRLFFSGAPAYEKSPEIDE